MESFVAPSPITPNTVLRLSMPAETDNPASRRTVPRFVAALTSAEQPSDMTSVIPPFSEVKSHEATSGARIRVMIAPVIVDAWSVPARIPACMLPFTVSSVVSPAASKTRMRPLVVFTDTGGIDDASALGDQRRGKVKVWLSAADVRLGKYFLHALVAPGDLAVALDQRTGN